jgi:hypothetical protein
LIASLLLVQYLSLKLIVFLNPQLNVFTIIHRALVLDKIENCTDESCSAFHHPLRYIQPFFHEPIIVEKHYQKQQYEIHGAYHRK